MCAFSSINDLIGIIHSPEYRSKVKYWVGWIVRAAFFPFMLYEFLNRMPSVIYEFSSSKDIQTQIAPLLPFLLHAPFTLFLVGSILGMVFWFAVFLVFLMVGQLLSLILRSLSLIPLAAEH
jgi:hypothetical protein